MSFERSISVLDFLTDETEEDASRLAINIDRRVVQETPVDQGTASGNWLASVDSPDNSVIEEGDSRLDNAEYIAEEVIRGASRFKRIYLQNNLPYIVPLSEGYSLQAPDGYIDTIINEEVARGGN